jgi:mannan endo-1,4-beta-mannosidase
MIIKVAARIVAVAGLAVITGCASSGQSEPPSRPSPQSPSCGSRASDHYVGFSADGFPPHHGDLAAIEQASGITPAAVSLYISLGATLDMSAVRSICAQGALPIVEIDSDQLRLTSIARGSQDEALAAYARDLAQLHAPVAVDFDHEFNGSWYDWGRNHQSPAAFVSAWRHVVTVFRDNGAANVTWIWNPAVFIRGTSSNYKSWYPGDSYVTWVGLDGYFTKPQSTFDNVFTPALRVLRKFTQHRVFIVETGANPAAGRVRAIKSLFAGLAATPSILGFIWFDYDSEGGHDWMINHDPGALAAFRTAARTYMAAG